jgi:hypothetical protein
VFDADDLPFPRGLPEFQRIFPDDDACAAYLEAIRWRDGFRCMWCNEPGEPYRFANRPHVLRCRMCIGRLADQLVRVDRVTGMVRACQQARPAKPKEPKPISPVPVLAITEAGDVAPIPVVDVPPRAGDRGQAASPVSFRVPLTGVVVNASTGELTDLHERYRPPVEAAAEAQDEPNDDPGDTTAPEITAAPASPGAVDYRSLF